MAPLSYLLGVSRQIAVQAFIFGDGFSNMIIPTNAVLMGILGMAGVPYDRWFRFAFPLILKLTLGAARSEERRVGKAWRSREAPEQEIQSMLIEVHNNRQE